jgi:hypothetical protein
MVRRLIAQQADVREFEHFLDFQFKSSYHLRYSRTPGKTMFFYEIVRVLWDKIRKWSIEAIEWSDDMGLIFIEFDVLSNIKCSFLAMRGPTPRRRPGRAG